MLNLVYPKWVVMLRSTCVCVCTCVGVRARAPAGCSLEFEV